MRVVRLPEIRKALSFADVIAAMRDAVVAQARGECDTPMPMHLSVGGPDAEVHVKSSYRRGGSFWALKAAGSFPGRAPRGLSPGTGCILLCDAATGDPAALFLDEGWMTDARTAAVAAMTAAVLRRRDAVLGILGSGTQARLQALLHAEVLPLARVVLWGRSSERARACRDEIAAALPNVDVQVADSPAEVASAARLVVTVTSARAALLPAGDVRPGTLVEAVGSDSTGKQELDPELLRRAALLLVDSRSQCEKLGELQHARSEAGRAIEVGAWVADPRAPAADAVIVADFTGLGVEDLAIAELAYRRLPPA